MDPSKSISSKSIFLHTAISAVRWEYCILVCTVTNDVETGPVRRLTFDQEQAHSHLMSQTSPTIPMGRGLDPPSFIDEETRASEDTGMYEAPDNTLRGFVVPSPASAHTPRPRTQVDLVLPPMIAFCAPGTLFSTSFQCIDIHSLSQVKISLHGGNILSSGKNLCNGQLFLRLSNKQNLFGRPGSLQKPLIR